MVRGVAPSHHASVSNSSQNQLNKYTLLYSITDGRASFYILFHGNIEMFRPVNLVILT